MLLSMNRRCNVTVVKFRNDKTGGWWDNNAVGPMFNGHSIEMRMRRPCEHLTLLDDDFTRLLLHGKHGIKNVTATHKQAPFIKHSHRTCTQARHKQDWFGLATSCRQWKTEKKMILRCKTVSPLVPMTVSSSRQRPYAWDTLTGWQVMETNQTRISFIILLSVSHADTAPAVVHAAAYNDAGWISV